MEQEIHFCTTADGVRIAYATAGQGPPFVKAANWLNHLEYDWRSPIWRPLVEEFTRDHLLVRYDERGNGLSDWNVADLSFEAFVRDLESVVDTLGLTRFPILGISQGGPVAIAYAVRHPEKVSHLILYGSYAQGWSKRGQTPEAMELRRAQITLIKFGWGQDNPAFRQLWSSLYMPDGTPEDWQWFNDLQKISASPENALRLVNELAEIDVVELLPHVKVPTIVIHRRGDAAVPFEQGRMLAASIPGARFIELEGNNHLLLETEAEWPRFISEVRRFLGVSAPSKSFKAGASGSSSVSTRRLKVGDRLGRYMIKSLLGEGGMGQVYLAEDAQLRRSVALKILPADLAANDDRMRRFVQEAQAAAALNHPNIAHIYEIGVSDNVHFIAMEFIDGDTLRSLIHGDQPDLAKLLRYLQHAADGLAKAHAAGIVHRDLKPDNIMVSRDGHAKILDFGLAKLVERQQLSASSSEMATAILAQQSQSGIVMGTVGYMSPEQAQGKTKEIDHRSDIFSFGCILYEAVTGHKAFAGKDAIESLNKIIREPVIPITDFNPAAPADLHRIVRRCLAKDPDERYQTIKDVVIELKEVRRELIEGARALSARKGSASTEAQPTMAQGGSATAERSPSPISTGTSSADYITSGIRQHKLVAAIIAVVILIIAAGAVIGLTSYLGGRSRVVAVDSIAVLPFVNQSQDPEADYLSDGLTESIINSLTQLPNLKVIARSSVFRYKGKQADPFAAGKELGVRSILTGRVVQRGDSLTISTELLDIRENKQLWGEQYERKVSDLLAVQRDIAQEITDNLRLKLSGAEQSRFNKRYTDNPEAYQLYLKGRFYWNKRDAQGLNRGTQYFQQAIDLDSRYALAYTGLADCYTSLGFSFDNASLAPSEAIPKAKVAALRALELDDSLAEAHTSLAFIKLNYDWDWPGAETEFKRALDLNPNYDNAHHWYSHYLMAMGRIEESLAESKRALNLDPLGLILNVHLGWHYLYAHQYDSAIDQLKKTLGMDPSYGLTHWYLGLAYEQKEQYADALAEFRKARDLLKENVTIEADMGHAYAVSGKREEAQKVIDDLRGLSKRKFVSAYHIALIYAGLGEKDRAFQWLDDAYKERSDLLVYLNRDPRLDSLRPDPRFADLVRRVGL